MLERRGELRLTDEPLPKDVVSRVFRGEHLEGGEPAETPVSRQEYRLHPSSTEETLDRVPGDGIADLRHRGRHRGRVWQPCVGASSCPFCELFVPRYPRNRRADVRRIQLVRCDSSPHRRVSVCPPGLRRVGEEPARGFLALPRHRRPQPPAARCRYAEDEREHRREAARALGDEPPPSGRGAALSRASALLGSCGRTPRARRHRRDADRPGAGAPRARGPARCAAAVSPASRRGLRPTPTRRPRRGRVSAALARRSGRSKRGCGPLQTFPANVGHTPSRRLN